MISPIKISQVATGHAEPRAKKHHTYYGLLPRQAKEAWTRGMLFASKDRGAAPGHR
jgi:hypothetical protein